MNYSDVAKKRAVALRYDPEKSSAPTIVATGRGTIAENIIKTAQDNGVSIKEVQSLAQALGGLDIGAEIPEGLYEVVAEVLLFVADVDGKYK